MNPDFSDYIKSIQESNSESERTERVARLIVLLHKMDKEFNTIQKALTKLKLQAEQTNPGMLSRIEERIEKVSRLQTKLRASRLTLNYHFI